MKSEKQSSTKALSFKDIEQKLLEEDISTIERLIDELKNKDEKIVTRIKKLLIKRGQFAITHTDFKFWGPRPTYRFQYFGSGDPMYRF